MQYRHQIQEAYNREHGITPHGITKAIRDITRRVQAVAETRTAYAAAPISSLLGKGAGGWVIKRPERRYG
ncbi:MAG: hypothetical protein ACXABY_21585 [Candidatus Thorarchaeota archaeon]